MNFDIHDWYQRMSDANVIFAYKGDITAELITEVLASVEAKLEDMNESQKLKKKLYNVLVEALQNLYHHIDNPPDKEIFNIDDRFAIFILSKGDAFYRISTGNFIRVAKYQILKDRLDQINYLSQEELKSLYKLILNNEEFSEKGGGGLGMIDIARKTGNKLDYKFIDYNKDYYFFSMEVLVN